MKRAVGIALGLIALAGILVAILVVGLTQTDRGHAIVRRIALHVLRGPIHGRVYIGRIEGNLLREAIIHDVAIADSSGKPFVNVRRLEAHYNIRDLLHKTILLSHIRLEHPTIVLRRTPSGLWNVQQIFPSDSTAPKTPQPDGWGSSIAFTDLRITDGTVIADTIATARALTTDIPRIILARPGTPEKRFDIASLRTALTVTPMHPADIRNLQTTLFLTGDSLWWPVAALTLPASQIATTGRFVFAQSATDLTLHADPIALADMRFAAPQIPPDGQLIADAAVSLRPGMQHFQLDTLALTIGAPATPMRIAGHGGIELGSTLHVFDTNLLFNGVDTRIVHAIAPSVALPRDGVLDGRIVASGTRSRFSFVASDLRFNDRTTRSVATAAMRGTILGDSARLDAAQLRAFATTLDANGTIGFTKNAHNGIHFTVAVDTLATVGHIAATATHNPHLDSLGGQLKLGGDIRGSVHHFNLHGTLTAQDLSGFASHIGTLATSFTWTGGPKLTTPITATIHADSVTSHGQTLDTVDAQVSFQKPNAAVVLRVRHGEHQTLALAGDVHLKAAGPELEYDSIYARVDSTILRTIKPGTVRWGPHGLGLQDVALTSVPGHGQIAIDGTIPLGAAPATPIQVQLAVDSFSTQTAAALVGRAFDVRADVTLRTTVAGTAEKPTLIGSVDLAHGVAKGEPLPIVDLHFSYDTTTLTAHAKIDRSPGMDSAIARLVASDTTLPLGSGPLFTIDAALPVDLALTDTGPRLLDRNIDATASAQQFPLDLISLFAPSIPAASGVLKAKFTAHGTLTHPAIGGGLTVTGGRFQVAPLGITLANAAAAATVHGDTIEVDSVVARSRGAIRLRGAIVLTRPSEATFNLTLLSHGARALDTKTLGMLDIDDSLTASGSLQKPVLGGSIRVRDGVLLAPDVGGKQVIDVATKTVDYVADTTDPPTRALIPVPSKILSTLSMNVHVSVDRNTWVRNKAANVEIYTDDPVTVHVNPEQHALTFAGTVNTDRGQYIFFSKRFQVSRGVATFVGTPGLDPNLNITGQYTVGAPGRPPLNIQILIGGTMTAPTLQLASDAQPPLTQTDLFTYLAFGEPASQLTGAGGGGGGGAGASGLGASNLAGSLGPYVAQRLASVAIGTFTQELQGDVARSLGADVLNITPAPGVPTEVSAKGVTGYLRNTELQFGKYMTPTTYVGLNLVPIAPPGAEVRTRIGQQSILSLTLDPWFLADPTLSPTTNVTTKDVFGIALTRAWRF